MKGHKIIKNTKAIRATFLVAVFVSLGGILMLNMLLFPSIPSSAKESGAEVGATVKEFIKLAVDTSSLALRDGSNNTVINPSPAGTMISGDVNLAVTTNTVKGYTLSVYTADSSTSMSNSNPSVTTNISSIATASGYNTSTGISDLAANTWGFKKSAKNDTATGNWFGVGANSGSGTIISSTDSDDADFCENLSYPLANTGCNSSTYDTYNIKFGAKLTSALPAGTYTNNVIFSAVAKSEGTKYTVNFNANNANATGTMNSRVMLQGSTITIPATTYQLSGYKLLGWVLTSSATTPTYTVGQTVAVNDLITAATSAGQSINSLTLYAIWREDVATMQDFDASADLPNVGDSAKLMDTRDRKKYTVKRLPDGKVWMMQNLTIGSDGAKTLTSADTNIDNNTTYYLPPAGKQGSSTIDDSSTLTATDTANFTSDSSTDQHAKTQFRTKDTSITNDSDTGYYNFYTATLGFSYLDDGKTSGSSTRDICPKGWRLPKTTDSGTTVSTTGTANDFTYLATRYNTSASWTNTATSSSYYTQDTTIHTGVHNGAAANGNNYAGFSYAGYWSSTSASASDVGSYGYYWSSSVYNTNNGYYLVFGSSSISPQFNGNKRYGYAVRCVAKDPTMQDFDASTSLPNVGDQMELEDARDGKKYTVKRLPDGKVWMMQNLSITNVVMTDQDTNLAPNATFDLTTGIAQSGDSGWCTTDSDDCDNVKAVYAREDSNGYLYNWYTATASNGTYSGSGANAQIDYDICPKGWHLPVGGDNNTTNQFALLDMAINPGDSFAGTNRNKDTSGVNLDTQTASFNNMTNIFPLAGYIYSSLRNVGTYGFYWSSTAQSNNNAYYLVLYSSNQYVNPRSTYSKYVGYSVRCVTGS